MVHSRYALISKFSEVEAEFDGENKEFTERNSLKNCGKDGVDLTWSLKQSKL